MKCPVCEKSEIYNEERQACLICWMTGRYFEKVLEDRGVLGPIKALDGVVDAAVWHNGGGAFSFGVSFSDGRVVTPLTAVETDEEGVIAAVAMIPPEGVKWTIGVVREVEGEPAYEGTLLPDFVDDEGLVALITEIAPRNKLRPVNLDNLVVDERYQRPVDEEKIASIRRGMEGGDCVNQEITVTYRAKSGNVTENEIREQVQELQKSAPSNWEIKEAHLNQPLFGSGSSTSGSGS